MRGEERRSDGDLQAGGHFPPFKWSEEGGLVHPATPPRARMAKHPAGPMPSHLQRQGSSLGAQAGRQEPYHNPLTAMPCAGTCYPCATTEHVNLQGGVFIVHAFASCATQHQSLRMLGVSSRLAG